MIIRWVCKRDNKKWLYPVEKCIYCKNPVAKEISRKAKIIGITKVNIPSPLHPITPYYVILLEDEHGNRMPKKTMKEYKIGANYALNPAKTGGAVIINKVKYDIDEHLKESLNLLHDYEIKEGEKVLIKPSIIEPAYSYQAVATNPRILEALIGYLKEKGVKDIIVAEQAMAGNDTIESAEKSGIIEVCKKHDVDFVDLRKSEFIEKHSDGFKFRIAKELFDRKIINIPVMKTNSQIVVSGAMENMLRAADDETQKRMFAEDIEKTLPKLLKALPHFLTVGDATLGMHGQGPTSLGEPAFLNMIFVSKDPVALDTVFSKMGILPMPEYIKEAANLGIGSNDAKSIEIVGDELEAIKLHLKPAEKDASSHQKIKLIDGKANPSTFNSAIKITSKLIGLSGDEFNLAIGSHITKEMLFGKVRLVAYGNDAIGNMRELDIAPLAEISDGLEGVEKIMLLKSILENPDKKNITISDKIKSKIANLGAKIKGSF